MHRRKTQVMVLIVLALAMCGSAVAAETYRLVQYNLATSQSSVMDSNWNGSGVQANSTSVAYYDSTGVYLRDAVTGMTTKLSSDVVSASSPFCLNEKYIKWNGSVMNLATGQMYAVSSQAALGSGASDYVYTSTSIRNVITGATKAVSDCCGVNETSYMLSGEDGYYGFNGRWTPTGYKLDLRSLSDDSVQKTMTRDYPDLFQGYVLGNCRLTTEWMMMDQSGNMFGNPNFYAEPLIGTGQWSESDFYRNVTVSDHRALVLRNDDYGEHSLAAYDMSSGASTVLCQYMDNYPRVYSIGQPALGGDYAYWLDNVPEPSSLLALGGFLSAGLLWFQRRRA